MAIFAIADLHLSGAPPSKPMDVFSPIWRNHWEKIHTDWVERVGPDDWVILAGDISWAMKWEAAAIDLQSISSLPGQKVLVRGNHDYWWTTVSKMHRLSDPSLHFLQNNHVAVDEIAICGSRGWTTPDAPSFAETDDPIYRREALRIRISLESARQAGYKRLVLALHFPPVACLGFETLFTDLIREFAVETCVFGHLHDEAIPSAPTGMINGAACRLIACDALDFRLEQLY